MGEVLSADASRLRQWQSLMGDSTGIIDNIGTSMMQAIGRVFRALKVIGSMIQGAQNDAYDTNKSKH
ncbi:hypothetical protein [Streptomyces sp. NPDC046988]|uniref:hypothetical protein n=1 Tax=Streptomyces sp. NPDC046988 TaxID=3154922 RepID=UPI0034068664